MESIIDAPGLKTAVGNYFVSNYPPYSCWLPEYNGRYLEALKAPAGAGPLGLYVHQPFCRQRCHYCYFRVYPRRGWEDVDRYIGAVLRELEIYVRYPAVGGRKFESVYFGGGSPSYPSVKQIGRLLEGLQRLSSWESVRECTFECEPGTVTPEKLKVLKELGVTRLSIGFQSLNDEILRQCGRDTTVADCLRAYGQAREAGFDEINIDLLAGLEGETDESWRETVETVAALGPECVTFYQFELPYNSGLYASMKGGRAVALPSWPEKRAWVDRGFALCEEAGYSVVSGYMAVRHPHWWRFVYTVDHTWHGEDILGLGESAFGHIQGVHYQNTDTFDRYLGLVESGRLPVRRALPLSAEERFRREFILLLKTGVIDAEHFRLKHRRDVFHAFESQLEQLVESGFIRVEDDELRLTRDGLLQVDAFLPMFYLPEHVGIRYT